MPRKGYKAVTVPSDLYEILKIMAESENRSVADVIKLLLYYKNGNPSFSFVNRWSGVQTPSGAPLQGNFCEKISLESLDRGDPP